MRIPATHEPLVQTASTASRMNCAPHEPQRTQRNAEENLTALSRGLGLRTVTDAVFPRGAETLSPSRKDVFPLRPLRLMRLAVSAFRC